MQTGGRRCVYVTLVIITLHAVQASISDMRLNKFAPIAIKFGIIKRSKGVG